MTMYCVRGKWGRHRRDFSVFADSMDEAVENAILMAKFYASGTRNYTTETWTYGSIEVVSGLFAFQRGVIVSSRSQLGFPAQSSALIR